jgi:hypothetical protein
MKFLFSLLALVVAFLIVFIAPEFSNWDGILAILTALAGMFGVVNWRNQFDKWKAWFESDTKLGAIIVGGVVVIVSVLQYLGVNLGESVLYIVGLILAGAGFGELISGARDVE